MKHVGRALQLIGLVLLPVGLTVGLANGDTRTELVLLAAGGLIFLIGKVLLERGG